jgi:hypothetical protein
VPKSQLGTAGQALLSCCHIKILFGCAGLISPQGDRTGRTGAPAELSARFDDKLGEFKASPVHD